ncbi:MAG TPA: GNAT family N-acetyltransferase [Chloroflexia bacterium]|nr:GNAT family N-acetyltransferase [Chloroflexia bacterium]
MSNLTGQDSAALAIRLATSEDAEAIARIYNHGIEERTTLETELRTPEERRQWLAAHDARHPVYVALLENEVVGWASLNVFNQREAYRFVADLSVYVARELRGKGIGKVLMQKLIAVAPGLGLHKLVLATFPHLVAVKMYESLNFRTVGFYREQGQLNGRWVDTQIMELILDQA